jgi:hypothetical protein
MPKQAQSHQGAPREYPEKNGPRGLATGGTPPFPGAQNNWKQCGSLRGDPCSCGGRNCDPQSDPSICVTCESRDITAVDLVGNNLSGTTPPTLGSLTELTYMDLVGNNLSGCIPLGLGIAD